MERVVTNVIGSNKLQLLLGNIAGDHIEIRQKRDGTYRVWYPEEGFLPCPENCELNKVRRSHKHKFDRPFVESYYVPTSLSDATDWAESLALGRDVILIPYGQLSKHQEEIDVEETEDTDLTDD
jgi:hypothetical protein